MSTVSSRRDTRKGGVAQEPAVVTVSKIARTLRTLQQQVLDIPPRTFKRKHRKVVAEYLELVIEDVLNRTAI